MKTLKEKVADRVELLKGISPWPWWVENDGHSIGVLEKGAECMADCVGMFFGEEPLKTKDPEFVATSPTFEDELIKDWIELQDSANVSKYMAQAEKLEAINKDQGSRLLSEQKENKKLQLDNKVLEAKVRNWKEACFAVENAFEKQLKIAMEALGYYTTTASTDDDGEIAEEALSKMGKPNE